MLKKALGILGILWYLLTPRSGEALNVKKYLPGLNNKSYQQLNEKSKQRIWDFISQKMKDKIDYKELTRRNIKNFKKNSPNASTEDSWETYNDIYDLHLDNEDIERLSKAGKTPSDLKHWLSAGATLDDIIDAPAEMTPEKFRMYKEAGIENKDIEMKVKDYPGIRKKKGKLMNILAEEKVSPKEYNRFKRYGEENVVMYSQEDMPISFINYCHNSHVKEGEQIVNEYQDFKKQAEIEGKSADDVLTELDKKKVSLKWKRWFEKNGIDLRQTIVLLNSGFSRNGVQALIPHWDIVDYELKKNPEKIIEYLRVMKKKGDKSFINARKLQDASRLIVKNIEPSTYKYIMEKTEHKDWTSFLVDYANFCRHYSDFYPGEKPTRSLKNFKKDISLYLSHKKIVRGLARGQRWAVKKYLGLNEKMLGKRFVTHAITEFYSKNDKPLCIYVVPNSNNPKVMDGVSTTRILREIPSENFRKVVIGINRDEQLLPMMQKITNRYGKKAQLFVAYGHGNYKKRSIRLDSGKSEDRYVDLTDHELKKGGDCLTKDAQIVAFSCEGRPVAEFLGKLWNKEAFGPEKIVFNNPEIEFDGNRIESILALSKNKDGSRDWEYFDKI